MALEENFSVEFDREIGTVVLTIERGDDPYHSFDQQFVRELGELIESYRDDEEIRAVIVTGEGRRVFSTGADIEGSFTGKSPADMQHFSQRGKEVFRMFAEPPLVTVAAINGLCLGGGLELAMSCDIRIASKRARLGLPEIELGILPGWGGTQLLPRLVGREQALKMILSGDPVSASTAEEIGLVSQVVSPDELIPSAKQLLSRITDKKKAVLARAKRAVMQGLGTDLDSGFALESELFGLAWSGEERREGVEAFLNRNDSGGGEDGSGESDE